MKVYAELLLYAFKFIFMIIGITKKHKAEENKLFMERLKAATDLLTKAIEGKAEAIDEKSYLSNIEWEEKERYKTYREDILHLLKIGCGYEALRQYSVMGMGERVIARQEQVVAALQQILSIEDKAKLIAQIIAR